MNEQGQYKEAVRTFNQEVKELREKLVEAGFQKQKLQEEVTALQEKVKTVRTNAVQKFKTSQSFIDSCADYYGTRFDDYLKQVASAFSELELSRISMDAPESMTPTRNVVTDDNDGIPESQPSPKVDDGVVLAQLAVILPTPVSKTPVLLVDAGMLLVGGRDSCRPMVPITFFWVVSLFIRNLFVFISFIGFLICLFSLLAFYSLAHL